jgi:hypothetical protein
MERNSHMRINRLTRPVPEYRLDEIRSILEYHELPVVLTSMLKYMPEENFRLMIEDLRHSIDVMLENQAIFEENTLPGQGALKILVGKVADQKLSPSECEKIGKIIASMEGLPRRNYVGMINFLGAACRIHHEIKDAYINAVRAQAQGNATKEAVPEVVYRMFPKKEMSDAEVKAQQRAEIERLSGLRGRAAEAQEETEREESQRENEEEQTAQQPVQQPAEPTQPIEQPTEEEQPIQEQPEIAEPAEKKPKKPAKPKPQFKQFVPPITVKGYRPTFITRTGRK